MYQKTAFTLIELLVVVLIIGILVAVALPQYRWAIAKTHYTNLIHTVENFKIAQETYYLSKGAYAQDTEFADMEILLPAETEMGTLPWGKAAIELPNGIYLRTAILSSTGELAVIGTDVSHMCNNYMVVLDHSDVHEAKAYCQAHDNTSCDASFGHKWCERIGGTLIPNKTNVYKLK